MDFVCSEKFALREENGWSGSGFRLIRMMTSKEKEKMILNLINKWLYRVRISKTYSWGCKYPPSSHINRFNRFRIETIYTEKRKIRGAYVVTLAKRSEKHGFFSWLLKISDRFSGVVFIGPVDVQFLHSRKRGEKKGTNTSWLTWFSILFFS